MYGLLSVTRYKGTNLGNVDLIFPDIPRAMSTNTPSNIVESQATCWQQIEDGHHHLVNMLT